MAKPPKAHFHFKESENLQLGADSEAVSTLQGMLTSFGYLRGTTSVSSARTRDALCVAISASSG